MAVDELSYSREREEQAEHREQLSIDPREVDSKGAQVRVSEQRFADLLRLCMIREDDLEVLKGVEEVIAPIANDVAKAFYAALLDHPGLLKIVQDNTSVARVTERE